MTSVALSLPVSPWDRVRQSSVAASAVIAVVGAFVGSGAAGGTPIQDAAGGALGANATILAPAGPAFSIWSVIYVGLLAYAVWQLFPSQAARPRQRTLGYWMVASLLLNAAWILSVQFGFLALSAVFIVLLLAVLVCAFVLLQRTPGSGVAEAIVFDGTVGLYLGWVMVATVANITSVLMVAGFGGFGWAPGAWGVALLAIVAGIGVALAVWGRGRLTPAIAISWGLCWIGVSRLSGSLVSVPVAVTAFVAAGIVLVATVAVRLVAARR